MFSSCCLVVAWRQTVRKCSTHACSALAGTAHAISSHLDWAVPGAPIINPRQQPSPAGRVHVFSSGRGVPVAAAASQWKPPSPPTDSVDQRADKQQQHIRQQPGGHQHHTGVPPATATDSDVWQQLLQCLETLAQQPPSKSKQWPQELQGALQRCSQTGATVLPAEQLLHMLAAAAQLQLRLQQPQDQLVSVLRSAATSSLQQLTPQQLPAVLAALHTVQEAGTGAKQAAADAAGAADTPPATAALLDRPAAALTRAVHAYLQQHQQGMDGASTAALSAVLAAMGQHSSFTILAMLALEHLQDMNVAQVLQLISAFADIQHYNEAVCDAAAQLALNTIKQQGFKLLQHQQHPVRAAADAELAATGDTHAVSQPAAAVGAARLPKAGGVHAAEDLGRQQEQSINSKQQGFTAPQLVAFLQALARLRHYDPALLEAACSCLLRSPERRLQDMVLLVHTCAQLNHFHVQLFESAVGMALQAMAAQQEQEEQLPQLLAALSWSCGIMGYLDKSFLQQLSAWSDQLQAASLGTEELLQWFQVQSSLTDAALLAPQTHPDGLSSHLLAAAQSAWTARHKSRRLTAFQKEVVEALQQAGVRCRLNVALDGPVVVDVALQQRQVGARYRVALQLHPHEDFAANPLTVPWAQQQLPGGPCRPGAGG